MPSSLALILRSTPRERIPISAAIWGATAALAGAVGPTLGAALVEWGGWRWVFVINLPVGVATIVMGRRSLRESRDPESMLPAPLGVGLLVAGSVLLTLGLVRGDDWGWTSGATVASIVGGVAVLCVFVAHQARTSAPAMDLSLFESHNFRWANAATIVFGIAFSAMFLSSILFLTSVWKWSILEAGFGVAPGPLLVALLAPRFGKLAAASDSGRCSSPAASSTRPAGRGGCSRSTPSRRSLTAYLPSMLLTGTGVALVHPAAVERDRPVVAAQPIRRRWRGQPGAASTRGHARRGGRGRARVGGDRHRRCARPVRPDLVDDHRRRAADDAAVDPVADGAAIGRRTRSMSTRAVVDVAVVD